MQDCRLSKSCLRTNPARECCNSPFMRGGSSLACLSSPVKNAHIMSVRRQNCKRRNKSQTIYDIEQNPLRTARGSRTGAEAAKLGHPAERSAI